MKTVIILQEGSDIINVYDDLESLIQNNQNYFKNFDVNATEQRLKKCGDILCFARGLGLKDITITKKVLQVKGKEISNIRIPDISIIRAEKKSKGLSM